MQIFASHHAERALSVDADKILVADLSRQHQPAGADAFEATAKVVELSVFKKGAAVSDRELQAVPDSREFISPDLAMSLLEEVQQARFREAKRLKRLAMLEHDIKIAQAQNEAMRIALKDAQSRDEARLAESGRAPKARRSFIRLFRK